MIEATFNFREIHSHCHLIEVTGDVSHPWIVLLEMAAQWVAANEVQPSIVTFHNSGDPLDPEDFSSWCEIYYTHVSDGFPLEGEMN